MSPDGDHAEAARLGGDRLVADRGLEAAGGPQRHSASEPVGKWLSRPTREISVRRGRSLASAKPAESRA